MVTRNSSVQIVRNSQDAENKEKKAVLALEMFAEFLFSLFHLLFGGIPPSCPGERALTAERGPHLQLHPPLLGLRTPTFLLLLCLPGFFKHRSNINHHQPSPSTVNTQTSASSRSKPALTAHSAQFRSASPLI